MHKLSHHQHLELNLRFYLMFLLFVFLMLPILFYGTKKYILGQKITSHTQQGFLESPALKMPKMQAFVPVHQEEGTQHHNERQ